MKCLSFHDGSRAKLTDNGYDLTLPNGKHVRGIAANIVDAEQAANAERDKYILAAWSRGGLAGRSQFLCPLK